MKYTLEIYPPGDRKTAHMVWTSETPFGSIQRGDAFNPVIRPDTLWRVTDVEHIIWGPTAGMVSHKIMVFTAAEGAR